MHSNDGTEIVLWIISQFFPDTFMPKCFVFLFFRVAIVSKSFEGKTDRTEDWYGTQYKQEAISDEVIKAR